ncbi:MAG: ROK family protein [Fimbriimonadales bacterium]|nr:ROK family protein [Fimbriimonadales bacterium]MDW8052421.1 ROK family protein [Armatimonadota bacterium]
MTSTVVGVDLGGTNVRAAVVNREGALLSTLVQHPSRAQDGFQATLQQIVRTIREAIEAAGTSPAAVGMAVPGHIDAARGVVRWAPNFGEYRNGIFEVWRDVPLAAAVQAELNLPVVMGNDANLAALGEYYYGVGRGRARGLIMITLGTGIGGGVVLSHAQVQGGARWEGGILLVGLSGGGAELGHTVIDFAGPRCGCGVRGCIEAYAKRDAIIEMARESMQRNPQSLLYTLANGDPTQITPALVSQAAQQGDPVALAIWHEVGTYLGVAIANFINIFNPEIVAIGGQIAKAGAPLFDAIHATVRNYALPTLLEECQIVPAERLEDAGILGGAALAWQFVEAQA